MAFDETRQNHPAVQLDDPGVRAAGGRRLVIGSDGDDPVTPDGDCRGPRVIRVEGVDSAAAQDRRRLRVIGAAGPGPISPAAGPTGTNQSAVTAHDRAVSPSRTAGYSGPRWDGYGGYG